MAKGDMPNSGTAQPVAPKQDQYSVMHGIMDRLGGAAGSLMPNMQTTQPVGSPNSGSGLMPMGMGSWSANGGNQQTPGYLPNRNFGTYGGDFMPRNMGTGQMLSGAIAPTNPQELIRRNMMGNNSYNPGV